MKKFLSIIMALAMILSLAACSQASENDLDEILTSKNSENETTSETTEEDTAEPIDLDNLDLSRSDIAASTVESYLLEHPDGIEVIPDDNFTLMKEVSIEALEEKLNYWYIIPGIYFVSSSASGIEFESYSGNIYMSDSILNNDIFKRYMDSGVAATVIGYFTEQNGVYIVDKCTIYQGELDDQYYIDNMIDTREMDYSAKSYGDELFGASEYASDPTGIDSGVSGNYYTDDYTNPNQPAAYDLMDNYTDALRDVAQNDPNLTDEQRKFAEDYADAYDFVKGLQGW